MNVCMIPVMPMDRLHAQTEERVYLQPGSIHVATEPTLINTVLGSSVAVCLWSPTVAGMNHFILPGGGHEDSYRFAKHALPTLLEKLTDMGAGRDEIFAAVFGGASSLGRQNIGAAREFLSRHDIPIIRHDVGGEEGRKLTFRTLDGSTIVRRL